MIKVYIASPYTHGDTAVNVRESIAAADELANKGFLPFVPLLSHFWHFLFPHPPEYWMKMDFEWVLMCDCVLRLPGESSGADAEVSLAKTSGVKVFYSLDELFDFFSSGNGLTTYARK